jgi:hypothetical protein
MTISVRHYQYKWLRRVASAVSALALAAAAARSWSTDPTVAARLTFFAAVVAIAAGFTWWQTRSLAK